MTRSRRRKRARMSDRPPRVLRRIPVAAAISGLAASTCTYAQEHIETTGLQTVVVTAQKRTENLQEVPLSIQAIDTERLEDLHVGSFNDYAKLLPSVAFQTTGPGFARVFMRGVASGDNGNHSGPLPSVGVYLDEQPITTIQGALDIHIYDIARVESLAGPQGTLYGASSQAGTIRIITNKPDATGFKAGYDVQGNTVAHGGNGYVAEGFANVPLAPNAAIRLVGWYERDPGYIDNVFGTRTYPVSGVTIDNAARVKSNYNDTDTYGARAALKVDLDENWTITPTIMGQEQRTHGNFGYDPHVGDLKITHFYPESSKDRWGQAALTVEGKISNFDVVYAGAFLKRDDEVHQDYSDYSFFYDVCCQYGSYITDSAGNFINPSQYIIGKDHYKKQSHELRVSSPGSWPLRFVGGLFYQKQTHGIEQRYKIDNLDPTLSVTGWPNTLWLTEQIRTDRDYAIFGELSYDILPSLTASGGIRFFKARNSLEGFYGFSAGFSGSTGEAKCFSFAPFHGAPCENLNQTVEENGHTPKLSLTYRVTDAALIYATWSKGFRPGGINRRGSYPPYKADYLTNYEVGWKSSWLDNRLRFNGAFFVENWDDFQFSFLGQSGLTNITNAGKAQIKGVEAQVDWVVTGGLTVSATATYLDPKLKKDFCKVLGAEPCPDWAFAPSGTRLPVTPKFKSNLVARYSVPIGSVEAYVQGSFVYQSSATSELIPTEARLIGDQNSYGIFDFASGVNMAGMTVELFVNNAFDKRAKLNEYTECSILEGPASVNVPGTPLCGQQPYVVPNQPRTVGIKFGQRFGAD